MSNKVTNNFNEFIHLNNMIISDQYNDGAVTFTPESLKSKKSKKVSPLINAIQEEAGDKVVDFISDHISLKSERTILFTSKKHCLIDNTDFNNLRVIINLQKVNEHQDINSFFKSINTLLPDAGIYIGCVDTYWIRKIKMEKRFGKFGRSILWPLDFLFNRVMPRIKITKKLHNLITRNKFRAISLSEALGRLVYCGFEIIEYKKIDDDAYFFVVMKTSEPMTTRDVSYGPIFPMKRVGKDGKIIKVYKLRTMHPYSEFLQSFVLKLNGYDKSGKPADDFRLTMWAKSLRKFWLDELPQLVNLLKGDLTLVGPRPLSQTRYNQLPDDVKKERIKYKPGCIPPYVSLCMPDATGNIEAERIFFSDMKRNRFTTPIRYFFKAIYNILTGKIHSA